MSDPDPYADDPFFKLIPDAEWNACIGQQGEEVNYLDGYIEAAIELVDAIIEKKLLGQRDTLVLPILFNARHGLELALKFSIDRLVAAGALKNHVQKRNHDISFHWNQLNDGEIGDEVLSQAIVELKPFVDSLSQVDTDGQELRYYRNRDKDKSLAKYALANLRLIQQSLRELKRLIDMLKYRTVDYSDERSTGSFTSRCSRLDLLRITGLLPPRYLWASDQFDVQKKRIQARFGLSNRQFSLALDTIQKCREMRAELGIESEFLFLSDDLVVRVVERWRCLHPAGKESEGGLGLDYFDAGRFEKMEEYSAELKKVIAEIDAELSPDALAELEAMFYFGRDQYFVEFFEAHIERTRKTHIAANNPHEEIRHIIEKTNFLQCIQVAAAKLGRLSLADRLEKM